MGRLIRRSKAKINIKTWQERTGNHNIQPGSVKHMIAEIADLRAELERVYAICEIPNEPPKR